MLKMEISTKAHPGKSGHNVLVPNLHKNSSAVVPIKAGLKISTNEQIPIFTLGRNAFKFFMEALVAAQDAKDDLKYPAHRISIASSPMLIFALSGLSRRWA